MTSRVTRDPVNQTLIETADAHGVERLGLMNNQVWQEDPKRLVFTLARYKFVAKMLAGKADVVEVGCGDGFCSRLVRQEVGALTLTDYDPVFIADIHTRAHPRWPVDAYAHDLLAAPLPRAFDALYCLDVLEHIEPAREAVFLANAVKSLKTDAVAIFGMPSLESQAFASPASKAGHVNCKTGEDFRRVLQPFFGHVFMFSMNDETVHTGFMPMAHYLIALCVGPKL
jgi:2-polyprenyl-3-methyl-5-hydroxy-6-metoxy-1,4-benzoquinol methylase